MNAPVQILLGLAMLLAGILIMTSGLKIAINKNWLAIFDNPFSMFASAIGFTVAVQSSSITTVMLVSLVGSGLIGLEASLGGVLGANVGTTITAWIAGSVMNIDAIRMAAFHTAFNAVWCIPTLLMVGPIARYLQRII